MRVSDPAPPVGSQFQVTADVSSLGPQPAPASELVLNLGPGIGYRSAVSSDPSDTCTPQTYGSEPAEPQSYPYYEGSSVTCALGDLAPDSTTTVTFTFSRTASAASPIGAGVYSSLEDPRYENNYDSIDLEADRSSPAETSVELQAPASPAVGTAFDVKSIARNAGPYDATEVILFLDLPGGLRFESVDDPMCSVDDGGGSPETARPGSFDYGRRVKCDLGRIPAGSSRQILVRVTRTLPDELWINNSVQVSNFQENTEDDFDFQTLSADTSNPADIALTKTAPASPAVDSTFDYQIRARNDGPQTARNVVVTDVLPDGVTFHSFQVDGGSCETYEGEPEPRPLPAEDGTSGSEPSMGGGWTEVACVFPSVADGGTVGVTITVTRTSPWELWNGAWASSESFDPDKEDNYASAQVLADPSVTSDLAVSMSGPATTPLVGETFPFSFTVTNGGPADAADVYAEGYLPEGLRLDAVSAGDGMVCSDGSYRGDPAASGESTSGSTSPYPGYGTGFVSCHMEALPSGSSSSATLTATRTRALPLWISSSAYSSQFDPVYENNYAELQIDADRSNPADLSLRFADPGKPEMDSSFKLRAAVKNDGPSAAGDVVANIGLPSGSEFVSATMDGGTCALGDGYGTPYPAESGSAYPEEGKPAPDSMGYGTIRCARDEIGAGESAAITISLVRRSVYEMWAGGWVGASNWDPEPGNDQDGVSIAGKPYPGQCYQEPPPEMKEGDCPPGTVCGGGDADQIQVGDCSVESGAGGDSVNMDAGPSAGGSDVKAGAGSDDIAINLSGRSDQRRRFEIRAGKGADSVTITAAPGTGDATVIVYAGAGRDSIIVDSALARRSLRIIVRGGGGRDDVRSLGSSATAPGAKVQGGPGEDTIFGGPGPDRIFGNGGLDLMDGRAGDDLVDGGAGRDRCRGGPGRDRVRSC